jgi:ribonuclease P protein component
MANQDFPKRVRLLSQRQFELVMAARRSASDGFVRIYGAANSLGHPRLGLVVSRRVGTATTRNCWKRALREAFRLVQHELPPCDLACIPQRDARPDVRLLMASLQKLATKIQRQIERGSVT